MRGTRHLPLARLLRGAPLLLAAACASSHDPPVGGRSGYIPLMCGQGRGESRAAEITPAAGGEVAVNGHSLRVPRGAVNRPTTVTITEVAARHIGVEVEPHGTPLGSGGNNTATLTLSYARCGGNLAGYQGLGIVEVRSGTTEVIRQLPGVVDPERQTVTTAALDHLGAYLLAGI